MEVQWATPATNERVSSGTGTTAPEDPSSSSSLALKELPDGPLPTLVPRFPGLLGHEVPRLYTPENRELTPETTRGFDCVRFLELELGWTLYPWQRWLYLHALELDEGGGYRFDTILVLVARQNGKTRWLLGLALWKLYRDRAKLVVNTAQNLDYAEALLAEADQVVEDTKKLWHEKIRYYETNGKHRLKFTDRRNWRAVAATRRGGRSMSVDLAVMDELREHTSYDAWNALAPTTTARPNSHVVAVSNAGDATSVVLRTLRDNALAKIQTFSTQSSKVFLAEWSVPDKYPDTDEEIPTDDESFYGFANPSLGWGFPLSKLQGYLETSTEAGFKTEHQCRWVDVLEPGCFSPKEWALCRDPDSELDPSAEHHFALDVDWNRTTSSVSVAGWREDERLHVETVAHRAGTDWLVPWLHERKQDPHHPFTGRVAVQARGAPASSLIDSLTKAGLEVVEWGGKDLANSAGQFHDHLTNTRLAHRGQPDLDDAVRAVKAKVSGDAWYLNRKDSPVPVSPVVSASAAAWLADRPEEDGDESAYEDSEFVVL